MTAPTTLDHYLQLLAPLSPRDKLALIARLSAELADLPAVGSTDFSAEARAGVADGAPRPPSGTTSPSEASGPGEGDAPAGDPTSQRPWPYLEHEWVGDETAEELIELLRSSRSPPREPIEL